MRNSLVLKRERAEVANRLLQRIASCGRGFFQHEGRVSRFEVDDRGRIWLIDKYREKRIYVAYKWDWRGFTEGGTLRSLIQSLADFIRTGKPIDARHFGPWPDWICGGDKWGYGEAMEKVRAGARELGVVAEVANA